MITNTWSTPHFRLKYAYSALEKAQNWAVFTRSSMRRSEITQKTCVMDEIRTPRIIVETTRMTMMPNTSYDDLDSETCVITEVKPSRITEVSSERGLSSRGRAGGGGGGAPHGPPVDPA